MGKALNPEITPAMRAEASAWIARLHGPKRNARVEAGFKSWLQAHAAHRQAFEQTTQAWESMGTVPAERLSSMIRWERVGAPRRWIVNPMSWAAAAAVLVVAVLGALFYRREAPLTTNIGEQRALTLPDGTRVYLNTASRLRVRYQPHTRRVELETGEALFEVAQHVETPFVVMAGEREITALGTSFIVRRDPQRLAVTLVDGKVAVSSPLLQSEGGASFPAIELLPGQRLTFLNTQSPSVDRPAIEKVTAWQRGLVILDATPLADAVTEMNRYSAVPLEIANAEAARLRISGAFRAGDSLSFARAMATTYRLQVRADSQRILLEGEPHRTY